MIQVRLYTEELQLTAILSVGEDAPTLLPVTETAGALSDMEMKRNKRSGGFVFFISPFDD